MRYQVSRNGQVYGPYTIDDLRRYVASGNVLASDLAKSEEMADWQSVADILGLDVASAIPPPPGASVYGAPVGAYAGAGGTYPDPPNLNWILLLVLGLVTFGLFTIVYEIVQVVWLKKVQPQTSALLYYMLFLLCSVLNFGGSLSRASMIMHGIYVHRSVAGTLLSLLASLGVLIFLIVYRFAMRNSLEQHFNTADPAGLRLGPVMTLLFGSLYFQYHFNRINAMKQALRYRGTEI